MQNSDLTTRLDDQAQDEIGEVARVFNTYNSNLRKVFLGIGEASSRIASGALELSAAADQMLRTSQDLAIRSEAQRNTGEATTRETLQLQSAVREVADHVQRSLEDSETATKVAQEGALQSQGAAGSMANASASEELSAAVNQVAGTAAELARIAEELENQVAKFKI